MTAEEIRTRGESRLADVRDRLARLEADAPKDSDALLRDVDELQLAMTNVTSQLGVLVNVHPDLAAREACEKIQLEATKLNVRIAQSRPIYDALSAIDQGKLDPHARRAVELTLMDMKRAGIALDETKRKHAQELRERITQLSQTYSRNLRDDVRTVELPLSALEGTPADYRGAHPAGADGMVKVTTDPPDMAPLMAYSKDAAARLALSKAYFDRARGNIEVFDQLRHARHELAQALGYPSFAAYNLEDKMMGSPENLDRFLDDVRAAAKAPAERQYAALLDIARREDPSTQRIGAWDTQYYVARAKDERFHFDPREVRPYLEYNSVRQAILDLAAQLFDLTFTPYDPEEIWHEDAEHFSVTLNGKPAGFITLDMHPRPGKNKWATSFGYTLGLKDRQLPHNVLVCNFPDPKASKGPALMEHQQVVTFFHEFGHLVHGIVRGNVVEWARLGRPAENDFMEAPSRFLEDYVFELDVLRRFAKHVETGAVIPEDLVRRLQAARDFGDGVQVEQMTMRSRQSLRLHDDANIDRDCRTIAREVAERETRFELLDVTNWPANWEHMSSEAYAAAYGTYVWSDTIAADIRTGFTNGLMDIDAAHRYRDLVLAPGGNIPAADAVKNFLGRPYNTNAFKERLAKSG
ncbi:MAG: Zn-dependent oligopeptidase [Chloroflexi bacterium]|nr:MAG: Zn-dependent oligopeptidase [Chloroflexota bacterium]TMC36538.1 MAG: Zn-dependent oligopeptidase [Chloroflexota bacterium]TMC57428.1 MAG: Zn-dependent oligopeptidase [Chloroflexota bacterium]TME39787.1 MAG: Zn-dependent oligopeptidase [Chloroflexota bacterium]